MEISCGKDTLTGGGAGGARGDWWHVSMAMAAKPMCVVEMDRWLVMGDIDSVVLHS